MIESSQVVLSLCHLSFNYIEYCALPEPRGVLEHPEHHAYIHTPLLELTLGISEGVSDPEVVLAGAALVSFGLYVSVGLEFLPKAAA